MWNINFTPPPTFACTHTHTRMHASTNIHLPSYTNKNCSRIYDSCNEIVLIHWSGEKNKVHHALMGKFNLAWCLLCAVKHLCQENTLNTLKIKLCVSCSEQSAAMEWSQRRAKLSKSLTFKVVPLGQRWANCHRVISSQLFVNLFRRVGEENQDWGSAIPLVNIHLPLFVADRTTLSPQAPAYCCRRFNKAPRGASCWNNPPIWNISWWSVSSLSRTEHGVRR